MILPAQHIRELCKYSLMLDPFEERTVTSYEQHGYGNLSHGLGPASYDVRIAEDVTIYPKGFVLASTLERFTMPTDVLAIVHDKSTWARRGVACQNTVIDPGWRGWLTLELSNNNGSIIYIPKGAPIAQIVFHRLAEPTDTPYAGKYQNQEAGPQSAR